MEFEICAICGEVCGSKVAGNPKVYHLDCLKKSMDKNMKNANYRKYNDHSQNSSTYHKKDGTPVRDRLKQEANVEIEEAMEEDKALSLDKTAPAKPGRSIGD